MNETTEISTAMFNDPKRWEPNAWAEYDAAALHFARRRIIPHNGAALPENMSVVAVELIANDPDAFRERVRATMYAEAQKNVPEYCPCGAELTQDSHCLVCGRIIEGSAL